MDLSRLDLKPHKLFHHLDEVKKWKNGEYFAPIYVELSPTDLCNQRCPFCYTEYMGHQKLEIEEKKLIRIFEEMGKAGVKSVQIQGTGEPLLNKGVPAAVERGKQSGLDIALCSNGVLFTEDVAEKVLPNLSWMRVSAIESAPDRYAKSHGCDEKQWHQLIDNLNYAVKMRNKNNYDVVLSCHFITFDYNTEYLFDTVKMCKDIGLDYVQVKPAFISLHNNDHSWERDTYLRYRDQFEKCLTLQDKDFLVSLRMDQFDSQKDCGSFPKDYKKCYGLEFETMIDSDACVYPCLNFWRDEKYCIGNLNEMSFEEIWKSDRRWEVLELIYLNYDLDKCHFGCKHRHINSDLWKLANPPMHVNFL